MKSTIEMFATDAGADRLLVALARPDVHQDVPAAALIGHVEVSAGAPDWRTLRWSARFRELYLAYMRGALPVKPAILSEAQVRPGEYVYVIDGRVHDPNGDVAFSDVIGWYRADAQGRPSARTFEHNADHLLSTDAGYSSLVEDPDLRRLVFATD